MYRWFPPVPIVNFWASPLGAAAAAAVVSAAAAVVSAAAAVVSAGLLPPEQAVSTIAQDNASAIAAENLFLISFYLLFLFLCTTFQQRKLTNILYISIVTFATNISNFCKRLKSFSYSLLFS